MRIRQKWWPHDVVDKKWTRWTGINEWASDFYCECWMLIKTMGRERCDDDANEKKEKHISAEGLLI